MPDTLFSQLTNLRKLFAEAAPSDVKVINDYGWTIVKMLLHHASELDSTTCRQLLADGMRLPLERPSRLHSALLSAAIKVSELSTDLHFVPFLRLWDLRNLRAEDYERQQSSGHGASADSAGDTVSSTSSTSAASVHPPHTFPSLVDRVVKAYVSACLLRPDEVLDQEQVQILLPDLQKKGYVMQEGRVVCPMLVTRIRETLSKEGRKLVFATLTSPQGLEVDGISSVLVPHPLHPLPEGKRHFVNVGQLYDCALRKKEDKVSLAAACLSNADPAQLFPLEMGFVESIDSVHGQMHVYDRFSRHFVAHVLRFSREQVRDFVHFLPVVPLDSKFKTAVVSSRAKVSELIQEQENRPSLLRRIRITSLNTERHFASWELLDPSTPITEKLSPLQLSLGETTPSFTSGFLSLTSDNCIPGELFRKTDALAAVSAHPQELAPGAVLQAVVYLRRGKDKQKRPYIACILQ